MAVKFQISVPLLSTAKRVLVCRMKGILLKHTLLLQPGMVLVEPIRRRHASRVGLNALFSFFKSSQVKFLFRKVNK